MAPLHRQYKTARTETRRHLLLKIRQMPTQTSASRGYVLFRGVIRDTHKSPKIVCRLADSFRGVSKLGKTRIIEDARRGVVRNTGFCGQNCRRLFYPELSGIGFWKYPLSPILAVRQSAFGACRLLRHGLLELRVIQVRIKALLFEQFFVSALLYDVAVLHDEDHIRIAYGRQAVCDDKAGR